jgi:dephospho-CoA kinase
MSAKMPSKPSRGSEEDEGASYEVWGLTGGIASGKSTAARMFAEAGIPVVDADEVARDLRRPGGAAHKAIVARFGTDDREKLRKIIFGEPQARKDIEAILHPLIVRESHALMQKYADQGHARVMYEAALLVETGRYREFTGLIVVDSSLGTRRQRLILRDGLPPELADRILGAQIPDEQRLAVATHVIRNEGSLGELRAQVEELITRLDG